MSSRVSRELIQPWISQISPEKFSPSQRLSVADFLFSLGFRTEAGVFLDQIEEALLPPSLQKNMFILLSSLPFRRRRLERTGTANKRKFIKKRRKGRDFILPGSFRAKKS